MDNGSVQHRSAWVWGAALAPAVAILPTAAAQVVGGWAAPLLVLPVLLWADRLLIPCSEQGFGRDLCEVLGEWVGRALTIIYIMWATVLGGTQLWVGVRRVERAAALYSPGWVLVAGMVLLAVWLVRGKASACAQWAMLALNGLLVVLGVIALLALLQVRRENLVPLWGGATELAAVMGAGFGVLCVRVYSGFVPGEQTRRGAAYPVLVCGVLSLLLLTVQGGLGAELASRLEDPLLTLSRNVGIEGTFRRGESVLAAVLLLAELLLLTLLLWATKSAAEQVWRVRWNGGWAAAGMFGVAMLPITQTQMRMFLQRAVPWGNVVLGAIVPLVVAVVARAKRKNRGISCG